MIASGRLLFSLAVVLWFIGQVHAHVVRSAIDELPVSLPRHFVVESTYRIEKVHLTLQTPTGLLCDNQPFDYIDPTGGKPRLISQVGSSDIDNTARVIDGVPQVHYSDYAHWWSPLTDGATTGWWQSPTNDELARLFQPTAGGYRLAGVYERSAVWDQQMATAFPSAMQDAQTSFGAFAKVSGGGIAAASGIGALYIGGTGGLVLAGHEFYAAGSNWLGAANGTNYPTTPEGLLAQSGGASDGVVTGVDLAALPLLGTLRFGPRTLYRGVIRNSPHDIQQAAGGGIIPRGGNSSAYLHVNEGMTNSPFTSWTSDINVARRFAGQNGVIFSVDASQLSNEVISTSPFSRLPSEQEFLIRGPVRGLKRLQ